MKRAFIIPIFLLALLLSFWPFLNSTASVQDEIAARNQQIEQLQQQIDQYQQQIDANSGKAMTLTGEINALNAQINKVQLEIRSLALNIDQTNAEIGDTQNQIQIAQNKLDVHKQALTQYINIIYQTDRENLTQILFKNATLSGFFDNLKNLQDTQDSISTAIDDIKALKTDLEQKENDLASKKQDLENLKSLQESEKSDLNGSKQVKDSLLKETKGQEVKFQALVKKSQTDIANIKAQVFYLQQNGVTVEDAIKFGQLAAIRVGIRPAFLIAILEVESGLGKNVGTGNWLDDMYNCYLRLGKPSRAEAEKAAFLKIVGELGLNPDTVRVSREPNYGCGGALGPAQFISTVWLGYESQVAQLTGHQPPSPWNIEDAFMASAVKLANAGATAQTRAAETAAAKAYVSGSPTCTKTICNSYANAVLSKAAVIEQNL
jgi:peptidoglycan hydrolase CwlO-like protein